MSFSLADLSATLLSWVLVYGAIVLFVALLLGAIGAPLPCSFLLLAAGAFVRQDALSLSSALTWALIGAIAGDSISFGLGHLTRGPVVRRYGQLALWRAAEDQLNRRGAVAIYLSRWLLPALGVPLNWVAGSGGYPYAHFLLFGAVGELTWVLLYGGLGYAFSDQWESISALLSNFGGLLLGLVILIAGIVVLIRGWNRQGRGG